MQMEATECGAAALAIVLGYFGKYLPLEEVRFACGVTRDGSRMPSMLTAAQYFGLKADAREVTAEQAPAGPVPAILAWEHGHFLVLEGARGNTVYLNDPALGRRRVTRDAFASSFSGVVLTARPDSTFRREGKPSRLLPKLATRLRGYEPALMTVLAVSLMLVVPGVLVPGLIRAFVDNILIRGFSNWLGPLIIGLLGVYLVTTALTWVQLEILRRVEMRLALVESAKFVWHVLRLPISFFNQRFTGDIAARIDANDRSARLLVGQFGGAILQAVSAIFFALMMVAYDPVLAAIAVVGMAGNAVVLFVVRQRGQDAATHTQTEMGAVVATAVIGLKTIETLKATAGENDFFARWAGRHARAIEAERTSDSVNVVVDVVPPLISALVTAAVLGVGVSRAIGGDITIGTLIAFMSLLDRFLEPMRAVIQISARVQQMVADLARFDDVLHHPLDPGRVEPAAPFQPHRLVAGHLSLRNVTFGFEPLAPPFIQDFSLDVKPGGWVALVGGSGSGKSTIANLITGLVQPRSGTIAIDGRPLGDWHPADLAAALASVDQDLRLFEGTLRENICLWDDTVPHQRVVEAVTDAGLRDVVEALPHNYDATIEEGGRNLSGGQRQRIEIARALVRDPAVLILDEATSALDPITEAAIAGAIRRRGCTCVIVAHRLSTVRDCDEIIVMDRGQIIERGRHSDLVESGGPYARLIQEEPVT